MSSNYWEPPKNNLALEINNLSKIYNNEDNNIALDNISLTVK